MNKILVIRFDALGDTILTLPFLDALRKEYPDAEITVIASPIGAPPLLNVPWLDVKIIDRTDRFQIEYIIDYIRTCGFDISFNVSEKIEGYEIPFQAKIPVRVGFDPGFSQFFKSVLVKRYCTHPVSYSNSPSSPQGLHEVERQFLLLRKYGIERLTLPCTITIPQEDDIWAKDYIKTYIKKQGYLLVLHLSNKWIAGVWDEAFLLHLIEQIAKEYRHIVLSYGPSEKSLAEALAKQIDNPNLTFFFDPFFNHWAAILKYAKCVITMDTSASHVAAGVSTPSVVVFNDKYFEHTVERWHPWMVKYRAIKRNIANKASGKELVNNIVAGLKFCLRTGN